jgi:hypothetical protein
MKTMRALNGGKVSLGLVQRDGVVQRRPAGPPSDCRTQGAERVATEIEVVGTLE